MALPPATSSIDPILDQIFSAEKGALESEPDDEDNGDRNDEDSSLEEEQDERDDEDSLAGINDKVSERAELAPSSNSATLARLAKVRQVNEVENKRKRSTVYIWDDKKRMEKFSKKRKKLAADVEELGALTGCYGFLCLSKYVNSECSRC